MRGRFSQGHLSIARKIDQPGREPGASRRYASPGSEATPLWSHAGIPKLTCRERAAPVRASGAGVAAIVTACSLRRAVFAVQKHLNAGTESLRKRNLISHRHTTGPFWAIWSRSCTLISFGSKPIPATPGHTTMLAWTCDSLEIMSAPWRSTKKRLAWTQTLARRT